MAYQSLYRRYRPRRFSEVRDQEPVVRALRNAVRDDRVGHAYLFSGPRGTGKTSTARILAKALNCEQLADGEPCGTCDSCLAIDGGNSYDVQELDAASNRGVDDVRELIGRVALGSPGRTKVYILDEVHMLTKEASAALLKTLEEPPEHVVFVLATTDPHKVLPTIRSRTQHYEFRLLGAEDLAEHVRWVIHDAGLDLGDDAVEYVLRQGGGSARDTLSALERVAAAGGVVDEGEQVGDLLDAVADADAGRALVAVADAMNAGRDPRVLGEALLARLRDVFLVRMHVATEHLSPAEAEQVAAWADRLGPRATTRALEAVGEALLAMRQAPDPRIPLEVALVKITAPEGDGSLRDLAARVAALEAALAGGTAPAAPAATPTPGAPAPAAVATPGAASGPVAPAATPAAAPSVPTPAPPTAGGGGPAAAARAQLAAQRADRASRGEAAPRTTTGPPAATTSPPTAPPAPPAPVAPSAPRAPEVDHAPPVATPAPAPEIDDAPPEMSAPPREPAAPAPAVPVARPAADAPPPDPTPPPSAPAAGLGELWSERVLPSLSGLTKAMYQSAELVGVDAGTATIRVDNAHHQQNCERKRPDVEAALTVALGSAITVQFEVGGEVSSAPTGSRGVAGGGASGQVGSGPGRSVADVSDDPEEHLAGHDVHDLDDAPDASSGGLAALTEAFPGAELLEET
jgi:DNA polymerase III subunit gamma/tau